MNLPQIGTKLLRRIALEARTRCTMETESERANVHEWIVGICCCLSGCGAVGGLCGEISLMVDKDVRVGRARSDHGGNVFFATLSISG
jgi:hypothetical protein